MSNHPIIYTPRLTDLVLLPPNLSSASPRERPLRSPRFAGRGHLPNECRVKKSLVSRTICGAVDNTGAIIEPAYEVVMQGGEGVWEVSGEDNVLEWGGGYASDRRAINWNGEWGVGNEHQPSHIGHSLDGRMVTDVTWSPNVTLPVDVWAVSRLSVVPNLIMQEHILEALISQLLRPTEKPIYCAYVNRHEESPQSEPNISPSIVAIIKSAPAASRAAEEACVFVLQERSTRLTPTIHTLLPIFSDFQLSMGGRQSHPYHVPNTAQKPTEQSQGLSKSEFVLSLTSTAQTVRVEVDNMDVLQRLVSELRRLIAVAREEDFRSGGNTHRWVQFYGVSRRRRSVPHPVRQYSMPVGSLGRLRSLSDADENTLTSAASSRTTLSRSSTTYSLSTTTTDTTTANPFLTIDPFAPLLVSDSAPWSPTALESPRGPKYGVKEQWIAKRMREREGEFVQWGHV
ncbi:hypothetical protein BC938DRAFT_483699, partial [Jimgerdemannia flammicorona]